MIAALAGLRRPHLCGFGNRAFKAEPRRQIGTQTRNRGSSVSRGPISRRRVQFHGSRRGRKVGGRPRHVAVTARPSLFTVARKAGDPPASSGRVLSGSCVGAGILSGPRHLAVAPGAPNSPGPLAGGAYWCNSIGSRAICRICRRRTRSRGRRYYYTERPRHVAVTARPSLFVVAWEIGGAPTSPGRVFSGSCVGAGILSGPRHLAVAPGAPISLGPFANSIYLRSRVRRPGISRRCRQDRAGGPQHVLLTSSSSFFALAGQVGGAPTSPRRLVDGSCIRVRILSGPRRLAPVAPISPGPLAGSVCRLGCASTALARNRSITRKPGHIDGKGTRRLGFGRVMLAQKTGERPHVAVPGKTCWRVVALGAIRVEQLRWRLAGGEILCKRRDACVRHHAS